MQQKASLQPSPINVIWLFMIVVATVVAAYRGSMAAVTEASFQSAKAAVELAIGLIGAMALWLGLIRVVEVGGGMTILAQWIRPLMVRLFPDVPPDHPAMSAMMLNIAANTLGLGNAATPLGLKAMAELDTLNPEKGTATDAMCLFLAINTSSVTLVPLSVLAVRASAGAANPGAVFLPTLLATLCSTTTAIVTAKIMARREKNPIPIPESRDRILTHIQASDQEPDQFSNPLESNEDPPRKVERIPPSRIGQTVFMGLTIAFIGAVFYRLSLRGLPFLMSTAFLQNFSNWLLPMIVCGFLLFGYFRGVKVYEAMTEGAVEGFQIAVRIIPFMVAIFVAIGMFRASGALDLFAFLLSPLTNLIGMPTEALTMGIIRSLSGSGAFGFMSEIVNREPDSFLSYLVSTIQGSNETTFYVLAVYFGSICIQRPRYALSAALCADTVGLISSLFICRWLFES